MHLDVCYCVQYMEKNGRGTGDPWSLRQAGLYQQYHVQRDTSTWILLQPSESVQRRLLKSLKNLAEQNTASADPFRYHILILTSSLRNWNEYILDLCRQVDDLVCSEFILGLKADLRRTT